MENLKPLTTAEVLDRLRRLGLNVTAKQLANDTVDRFLPPRELGQVREGRGRTALWEPSMVRRAERLYRLRRRRDESGQPLVYGDTLRLLLFVRDGWGWSAGIKELCLRGLEKSLAATVTPVRRYVRSHSERENVECALEVHEVKLSPAERYAAGTLSYGEPLEGGSLKGVFRAAEALGLVKFPLSFVKLFAFLGVSDSVGLATNLAEKCFRVPATAYKEMLKSLDDRDAQLGMPRFLAEFIRPIRSHVHRAAVHESQRSQSTNPFTMFGRTQRVIEQAFRERGFPKRITPSQALALFVGIAVLSGAVMRTAERLAGFALTAAAKMYGIQPPTREEEIVPFASKVMQLVFGVQVLRPKGTPPT